MKRRRNTEYVKFLREQEKKVCFICLSISVLNLYQSNGNFNIGNQSCMVAELHMGGDLNENDNVNVWKLIIPGYTKLQSDDFDENQNYKVNKKILKRYIIYYIIFS